MGPCQPSSRANVSLMRAKASWIQHVEWASDAVHVGFTCGSSNWVKCDELPRGGIVVPSAQIVEARFRVPIFAGVSQGIRNCPRAGSQLPISIEVIGCLSGPRAVRNEPGAH